MVTRTETEVESLDSVRSAENEDAAPATDQSLNELAEQGGNGQLRQATVTVGNTPLESVPVPDGVAVEVQAHHDNQGVVFYGDSEHQERALAAREFTTVRVDDLAELHARGSASDRLVLTFTEADS